MNDSFGPLSEDYWNKILKKVMVAEHIGIDKGRKKFGLNHRFRHGFAMRMLHEKKLDPYIVKSLMRQANVSSLEPYLKLTPEGVKELRNRYTKEKHDVIEKYVDDND
ncbi:hypothetical protein [Selenomonas sp.]|uniref:hypothetical protein n=1 Tax=Selenomonas sp. TaxID=2053611 RepID=UPI0025F7718E|nr:hypothetical protein [Selenomonas sp.]